MIQVDPALTDDEFLRLFEKGVGAQWGSDQIDWGLVENISPAQKSALGHVITPVFLGEQTAMLGVSAVLPMVLTGGYPEATRLHTKSPSESFLETERRRHSR